MYTLIFLISVLLISVFGLGLLCESTIFKTDMFNNFLDSLGDYEDDNEQLL